MDDVHIQDILFLDNRAIQRDSVKYVKKGKAQMTCLVFMIAYFVTAAPSLGSNHVVRNIQPEWTKPFEAWREAAKYTTKGNNM